MSVTFLTNVDRAELESKIANGGGSGGLPSGGEPNKILVTDADGNTVWEDRTHYSKPGTIDILPETVPMFVEDMGGFAIVTPYTVLPTVGNTYTITFNGAEYECVCHELTEGDGQLGFSFGNVSVMGYPFETTDPFAVMLLLPELASLEGGVYGICIPLDDSTSVTLSIKYEGEIVKKIDKKYIETPDWDAANERNKGFILNRPFGYNMVAFIEASGTLASGEGFLPNPIFCLSQISITDNTFPGDVCEVNYCGEFYTCRVDSNGNIGNYECVFNGGDNNSVPFCITGTLSKGNGWLVDLSGKAEGETFSVTVKRKVFKKLPSDYIASISDEYLEEFDFPTTFGKSMTEPYVPVGGLINSEAARNLFKRINNRGFANIRIGISHDFPLSPFVDISSIIGSGNYEMETNPMHLSNTYVFTLYRVTDTGDGSISYYCTCDIAIGVTCILNVRGKPQEIYSGIGEVDIKLMACPHNYTPPAT